jgi:2-methylcitrate dehydratase
MDTITAYLSDYATTLTFADIPISVSHHAKRMLIDTLGCAIGGFDGEPSHIARTLAATISSSQPATVLGSGQHTSVDMATFVNGVMIRYLDYNDGYTSKESGHPSDAIAAVLSPAEVMHANGKDVLTAIILAYEVFCRLCDAVCVRDHGFDHVTLGVLASAMGAAKIMGLPREQTAQALNLALASNLALYQTRIGDVSLWKGCAFANASRNAVFAVQLAAMGMTGPAPIFAGVGGFFRALNEAPFTLAPFGSPSTPFKILECTIKRFALGLYSQTVADAALQVRQQLPGVDSIQEIHVHTLQTAVNIMAGDAEKWQPRNRETADHSMPYATAVALMYGAVEAQHFDETYWRNPDLLALVQKIHVHVSEEANRRAPEAMLSRVEVLTTAGQRYTAEVPYHRGHWKNPMSDQEVEDKFRALVRDVYTPTQTDAVLERLWHLEEVDDIGQVIRLMQIAGAS